MSERSIFLSALDLHDATERLAYLDQACGGDAKLRAEVEALLDSHDGAGAFLETPAVEQVAPALPTVLLNDSANAANGPAARSNADDSVASVLALLQPSGKPGALGRIGHYDVLEVLGQGAFGIVLKAFDDRLHRLVAIKAMNPELAATSPPRKRFLREARSSAKVGHENIVAIHAVEEQPIPYLVMEYIPGQSLQQRLDQHGPLEVAEVLRIGRQIASGLAAAHAQGLIHRDIKPANILLESGIEERAKITDFGLARAADDASLTQSGLIAGTPLFMAPEQAKGQPLDPRADLFSLGSVLYTMVSGRPPFRAPNTIAVLKRVCEDTPRPIQEVIPETPSWLCEIIARLHAKEPEERFQSAKEVADLLATCLTDLQQGRTPRVVAPRISVIPAATPTREPSARSAASPSRRSLLKAAAVVLILAAGLGITEATGVTKFASTVIRLATGSGTLVIETDDAGVQIAINGEKVTIRGGGVEELTLRPGEYQVQATKDGQQIKQELVSITRNGRTVLRMSLEPSETIANSAGKPPSASPTATAGLASGQPIDLISLLEPGRDFLDDRLKLQDGKLITPPFKNAPGAIGMIPYGPVPADYDIQLQLQRLSTRGPGFNMGLLVAGRQVAVGMDSGGSGQHVWGLDFLDGVPAHHANNPTRNPGSRLPIGKTCEVTIQVRKNHITASCDGATLIDWTGEPERLSLWKEVKLPSSDALFFWAQADFVVHKMTLIPRGAAPGSSDDAPPLASAGQEQWQPLFNGRDLSGWSADQPFWIVEEGCIVGRAHASAGGVNSFLIHEADHADFELRLDYRLINGNSGIQFRSTRGMPTAAQTGQSKPTWFLDNRRMEGPQVEIGRSNVIGQIYREPALGFVYVLNETNRAAMNRSVFNREWNEVVLRCQGDRVTIDINQGRAADRVALAMPPSGLIALQLHSFPATTNPVAEVRFRNIRLQQLGRVSASSPAADASPPTVPAFTADDAREAAPLSAIHPDNVP
jgi:serine/threonine protein kinase